MGSRAERLLRLIGAAAGFSAAAGLVLAGCQAPDPRDLKPGAALAADERPKAPSGQPYSEPREACAKRDPLRSVFWGELHVHSALSFDADLWDVRGTADDVYRFARGERVGLAPYDV